MIEFEEDIRSKTNYTKSYPNRPESISLFLGKMAYLDKIAPNTDDQEKILIARSMTASHLLLERKTAELERIEAESKYDHLTGLLNRKGFWKNIQTLLGTGESFSDYFLIYEDLNGLKQLNDNESHEAGDAYLCENANTLLSLLEDRMGFAARWGGDEFIVIIKAEEEHDVQNFICEALSSGTICASFGYTRLDYSSHDAITKSINEADGNMYSNKRALKKDK